MMKKHTRRLVGFWVCLLSATACGEDDTQDPRDQVGSIDAGTGTAVKDVMDAARSSTGVDLVDASRASETASDAAVGDAATANTPFFELGEPAACGSTQCPGSPPLAPGKPGPKACCVDASKGTCGKEDMNGKCQPPPPPDARCPSFFDYKGCCTSTEMCGVDVSVFNLGCVDVGDEMFRLFNPNAPGPRRCDQESDAGIDVDDAGAADGG
jgi:hypothetical protein